MPKLARTVPPAVFHAFFALAALCALFTIAASQADAAPWTAAEQVSTPGTQTSFSKVGVDANGDATAIWARANGGNSVVETAYRPVAAGWEAPVELTQTTGGSANQADLAVNPAGDAVAVWHKDLSGTERIEVASRPAGGVWQPSVAVYSGAQGAETPSVSIDEAGDIVIVWRREFEGTHVIEATYSLAGSGSWGAPVMIASTAVSAEAPDVAIGPTGTAVAVWQSSQGGVSVTDTSMLTLGGSWSPLEALSLPATITEIPQVRSDAAGDFFAIWSRGEGGNLVAEVTERPAGGGWQAPTPVSTPGQEAHSLQLAVSPAGDAVAAWYRFDGSVGTIEAANLTAGGAWAPPTRLSSPTVESEGPAVAIGPSGTAVVVWTGSREAGQSYEVNTSRLRLNASWKATVTVTHEGRAIFQPRIGIDRHGHTVVTWSFESEFGVVIKSSTHEDDSPLLVGKSGPGTGTVTSQPAGIDCGAVCLARFPEESSVTLTAAAAAGSQFAGWSGACTGSGSCTLEIGEALAMVGAEFVPTSSGDGETTTTGGKAPATPPQNPRPSTCAVVGVGATVGTFVPAPKPGQVVPGIRAKVGVKGPSSVRVTATLIYGAGKARRVELGSVAYHGAGDRNLRFALPATVRSVLPLGTPVWVSLGVAVKPDSVHGCASPGTVAHNLKVKVAKVLSSAQAGVS
jgi:hypothetical protein